MTEMLTSCNSLITCCNEIVPTSHWSGGHFKDDVISFLQCMAVNSLYKYLQSASLELRNSNLAKERKSGGGGRGGELAVRRVGCLPRATHWCMAS